MAAEAEAARDARAKVIAADGEKNASRFIQHAFFSYTSVNFPRQLVEAADVIASNKVSLHLRYLQTLIRISSQYNHTYVSHTF
jgi:erythrocyte band 7 integral membrane protein